MKTTSVSNPESATKVMHISEINLTYKEGRPMFWIDKEGNIVRERNGSRPVMLHKDTIPKLINRNYYKLIGFLTTNSNWKGAWFEVTEIITGGPVKETTVHASFTYSGTGPIFKLRKGVIVGLDEKGLVVFPSKNLLGRLEFGKEYESIGLVKVFPEKKAGTYHVSSLKKMDRVNGLGEEDQLAAEKAIEEIANLKSKKAILKRGYTHNYPLVWTAIIKRLNEKGIHLSQNNWKEIQSEAHLENGDKVKVEKHLV